MSASLTTFDVAIGLVFVYLLLSLICSVINEWVSAVFRRRARNLIYGIRNMLEDSKPTAWLPVLELPWALLTSVWGFISELFARPAPPKYKDSRPAPLGPKSVTLPIRVRSIITIAGKVATLPVTDPFGNLIIDRSGKVIADTIDPRGCVLKDNGGNPLSVPIKRNKAAAPPVYEDAAGAALQVPVKDGKGRIVIDATAKLTAYDGDGKLIPLTAAELNAPAPDQFTVTLEASDAAGQDITLPVKDEKNADVVDVNGELKAFNANMLLRHPLVRSYYQGERAPSYLPANAFALALLNLTQPVDDSNPGAFEQLRAAVRQLPEPLRGSLLPLIDSSQRDVRRAREQVENWYNECMDRVTGIYKRWNMLILFVIGAVLATVLNADTFTITRELWRNPAVREATVTAARRHVEATTRPASQGAASPKAPQQERASPKPTDPKTNPADPALQRADTIADPGSAAEDEGQQRFPTKEIDSLVEEIDSIRLLPGWKSALERAQKANGGNSAGLSWWLSKILGLLFTAAALSLGAPFWFDTLNRFINLRSSIKTDDDTDNKAVRGKTPPPASATGTTRGTG